MNIWEIVSCMAIVLTCICAIDWLTAHTNQHYEKIYRKRKYKNFKDFLVCTTNYYKFTVYTDLPDDMATEIIQKKCKETGEEVLYIECMDKMVYERELEQEY